MAGMTKVCSTRGLCMQRMRCTNKFYALNRRSQSAILPACPGDAASRPAAAAPSQYLFATTCPRRCAPPLPSSTLPARRDAPCSRRQHHLFPHNGLAPWLSQASKRLMKERHPPFGLLDRRATRAGAIQGVAWVAGGVRESARARDFTA